MPIHVLSEQLAAQIAAGEVVERPASVVKELIENAIDAGAGEVKVEVRDGGKRLIRVGDDGSGIPAADAELAFVHHATSKLATSDDLFAIRTLGFRGEALPSIASVSHVTLLTRTDDEEAGTELKLSGGRLVTRVPHAAPRGTLVAVENLFYNVPARLKFLKATQTEAGHIHELVNRHALAYPAVRFSLMSENRLIFQSSGNGSMGDALVAVYGIETAKQMIEIAAGTETGVAEVGDAAHHGPREIFVNGFVSKPSLSRANRSHMIFFVNGRAVQDRNLTYAVSEAYHTLLQVGRYPLCIVMVQLPLDEVDVNVHPTKAEVRFRETHRVFSAVQRTVRHALMAHPVAPPIAEPGDWPSPEERQANLRNLGQFGLDIQRAHVGGGSHTFQVPTTEFQHPTPKFQNPTISGGGGMGSAFAQSEPDASSARTDPNRYSAEGADQADAERLPMLRVLGQVARTYIVAEGPEGIFLIDQHAAHERVLYEKLRRSRLESGDAGYHAQGLLEPLAVELNPQQAARLDEQLDLLHAVGFQIEPFGGTAYLLRAVPVVMSEGDPRQALTTILDEMADEREWLRSDASQPLQAQREAMLIASVCKQGAIKAGRVMNLPEMQELIHQLEQSESPRTCPHGRPTVIRLALDQLARQFGRG
jgi:DNA mismatch repair protein MutL